MARVPRPLGRVELRYTFDAPAVDRAGTGGGPFGRAAAPGGTRPRPCPPPYDAGGDKEKKKSKEEIEEEKEHAKKKAEKKKRQEEEGSRIEQAEAAKRMYRSCVSKRAPWIFLGWTASSARASPPQLRPPEL